MTRRALACALLACAVGTPAPAQRAATPERTQAWRFRHATTVETSRTAAGSAPGLVMDVTIWNGIARVTFAGAAGGTLTGPRGALLVRAGDTLMAMVNPDRREVLVLPSTQLGTLLGGAPGGATMEVGDVSSTVRRGGAGPRIEGHATQHASVDQQFTITGGPATMRRTLRMEQHLELDISASLSRLDRGFEAFATQLLRSVGTPPAAVARLRALQRTLPAGFPARTVTTAITIAGGDTLRTTSTAAISQLRREPVDTTLFVVPGDYRVTELARLLQPRRSP